MLRQTWMAQCTTIMVSLLIFFFHSKCVHHPFILSSDLISAWKIVSQRIAQHHGQVLIISEIMDAFDASALTCGLESTLNVLERDFREQHTDVLNPALVSHWYGVWSVSTKVTSMYDLLNMLSEDGSLSYALPSAVHGAIWQTMLHRTLDNKTWQSLASLGELLCSPKAFSSFARNKFVYAALHECLHGVGHGAFYGSLRNRLGFKFDRVTQPMLTAFQLPGVVFHDLCEICRVFPLPMRARCFSGVSHAVWQFSVEQSVFHEKDCQSSVESSSSPIRVSISRETQNNSEMILIPEGSRSDTIFDYDLALVFFRDYRMQPKEEPASPSQIPCICTWCSISDHYEIAWLHVICDSKDQKTCLQTSRDRRQEML